MSAARGVSKLWCQRIDQVPERSESEGFEEKYRAAINGGPGLEGIPDRTAAHRVQAGRAGLTDSFASGRKRPFMKAGCGKTARPVCHQLSRFSPRLLLLKASHVALSEDLRAQRVVEPGMQNVGESRRRRSAPDTAAGVFP